MTPTSTLADWLRRDPEGGPWKPDARYIMEIDGGPLIRFGGIGIAQTIHEDAHQQVT